MAEKNCDLWLQLLFRKIANTIGCGYAIMGAVT